MSRIVEEHPIARSLVASCFERRLKVKIRPEKPLPICTSTNNVHKFEPIEQNQTKDRKHSFLIIYSDGDQNIIIES